MFESCDAQWLSALKHESNDLIWIQWNGILLPWIWSIQNRMPTPCFQKTYAMSIKLIHAWKTQSRLLGQREEEWIVLVMNLDANFNQLLLILINLLVIFYANQASIAQHTCSNRYSCQTKPRLTKIPQRNRIIFVTFLWITEKIFGSYICFSEM